MNRIMGIMAGLSLMGSACAAGSPGEATEMESAEQMEQTEGDERSMEGTNPGEMEGWMPPNAEEDVEMETEPYPE
ncbi:MAG: hypothetical protein PVH21_14665 [Myxococcales bacterium]|jgi:hypothetical protein